MLLTSAWEKIKKVRFFFLFEIKKKKSVYDDDYDGDGAIFFFKFTKFRKPLPLFFFKC